MKSLASLLFSGLICFISYGQQNPELSDPEVASVAVVANQIDIDYATIALERSQNKEIREFANRMKTDHNAVIRQAVDLVTKLSVTPKDNEVSRSLLNNADKIKKKLLKVNDRRFDKVYIKNEINYHKAVIAAVEDLLIPQSDNYELKGLLEAVLPALEAHRDHAIMVKNKL